MSAPAQTHCSARLRIQGEMLPEYYELRGWDKNGVPTPEKLAELALA